MSSRQIVLGAFAFVLCAIVTLVMVWPDASDEDLVREAIQRVADGAREADLAATLKPVSSSYVDDRGLVYDEVKLFLFREFQRRGPITVLLSDIAVTVEGDAATADFNAFLADGISISTLDFAPGEAEALHFLVQLRREGGDWQITGSSYDRLDPEDWPLI